MLTTVDMNAMIFPNPSTGLVNVAFNSAADSRYVITLQDMEGRSVFSDEGVSMQGDNKLSYDFGKLSTGMYLMNIQNNEERAVIRLIIE